MISNWRLLRAVIAFRQLRHLVIFLATWRPHHQKKRTAANCPDHLSPEIWEAGVDLKRWLGMHEMKVRWAPPESWRTTSVFVHPTATAGDVKHFLQDVTNIKHTQCTLVGAHGEKIPYWVEVHSCSKVNPDPTETKVLIPTVDRLPDSICMPCIFALLFRVSGLCMQPCHH